MDMLNRLLKKDKKLIAAYLGRGTAYALQGNLTAACNDFSQAIEIEPKVSDAWKRRGQVLTLLVLLVQKYKYGRKFTNTYETCRTRGSGAAKYGIRFTCFTGTKVQILTHLPQTRAALGLDSEGIADAVASVFVLLYQPSKKT